MLIYPSENHPVPKRRRPLLSQRTESRLSSYRSRPAAQRGPSGSAANSAKSWGGYAAATGAAMAGAHSAEATIVHVTPPNPIGVTINTSNTSTVGSAALDIDDNSVDDLELFLARIVDSTTSFSNSITYNTFSDVNGALGFPAIGGAGQWAVQSTSSIRLLQPGDLVSSGQAFIDSGGFRVLGSSTVTTAGGFSTGGGFSYGQFPTDGTALAGFRFQQGPNTHYGWIRLRLESGQGGGIQTIEALEWAYESTPDGGIAASAVIPEPTGLALLATGAAGVAALRRRDG